MQTHASVLPDQDGGKRAGIDAAREDAALRRRAAEDAAQQERERQWRVARGTATPEDLRGPVRFGPAAREAWMTELPEAARPSAVPTQTNVVRPARVRDCCWRQFPGSACGGRCLAEIGHWPLLSALLRCQCGTLILAWPG